MEVERVLERVGALIAARRRTMGLTQEQLAEQVGASPEWISHVERGRQPSLPLLLRIGRALQTRLPTLLGIGVLEDSAELAELRSRAARLPPPALRVLLDNAASLEREFAFPHTDVDTD